jgi:hypothetical protein
VVNLFLDTEFNGFGGKLISMALVPQDLTKPEFYRELLITEQLDPWVRDNVVPHLFQPAITFSKFQQDLATYLHVIGPCNIIVDWPDDIKYFCEALITGPGERINLSHKITFELDLSIEYQSLVPHNALADARAIGEAYSNVKAGAEIHAGDGGYSLGTQEGYEAFVAMRNRPKDE